MRRQHQGSLLEQLRELIRLANTAGLYDAADWIDGFLTRQSSHPAEQLPLRPASDPQTLAAQLRGALRSGEETQYLGYLAQIAHTCLLAMRDGDRGTPRARLELLAPALHLGERLPVEQEIIEAVTWVRATAWLLEIAEEILVPPRDPSEVERAVLLILASAGGKALSQSEVEARWSAPVPLSPDGLGAVLASLHERRFIMRVRQATEIFYRAVPHDQESREKDTP